MWKVIERSGKVPGGAFVSSFGGDGDRKFYVSNGHEEIFVDLVQKNSMFYLEKIKAARRLAARYAATLNESPTYP